ASIIHTSFPRAHEVVASGEPLTPWQLRELFAALVWRNLCLKTRPRFATIPIPKPHFEVELPERVRFAPPAPDELGGEHASYGKFLLHACARYFEAIPPDERAEAEALALKGELTFFRTRVPTWPPE